jgi:hypothetical protein
VWTEAVWNQSRLRLRRRNVPTLLCTQSILKAKSIMTAASGMMVATVAVEIQVEDDPVAVGQEAVAVGPGVAAAGLAVVVTAEIVDREVDSIPRAGRRIVTAAKYWSA